MTKEEIKFNNPRLQRAHDESKLIIKKHLEHAEKISSDLNKAEIFLRNSGIGSYETKSFSFFQNDLLFYCDDVKAWRHTGSLSIKNRLICYDLLPDFISEAIKSIKI